MRYIKYLFIMLLILPACRTSLPTDYNVVIIGIDTCRKDHMSCYDYLYATTPQLEKLAQDSVVFHNAYSTTSWTLPAFASLFTSCYPSVHSAYGQFDATFHPIRKNVPNGIVQLSRAGLKTQAYVNAPFLLPVFGFDRGFDDYDASRSDNARIRQADATFSAAMGWIQKNQNDPFLLFIHLFDPHLNYDPTAEHMERMQRLTGMDYRGYLKPPFSMFRSIRSGDVVLTQEDWDYVQLLYDAEISFVDEWCGRFVEYLKKNNLYEKTMLIVLSDHGEEFMDHQGFEHGHTHYQELVNIPLIIKFPSGRSAGKQIHAPVSLVDVMPTIFDVLSLEAPNGFQGRTLTEYLRKESAEEFGSRPVFSEQLLYGRETKSVISFPWKLIAHYRFESLELYNLMRDPGEKNDLYSEEHEIVEHMKYQMKVWIDGILEYNKDKQEESPADLDKKALEELKSLGYIR